MSRGDVACTVKSLFGWLRSFRLFQAQSAVCAAPLKFSGSPLGQDFLSASSSGEPLSGSAFLALSKAYRGIRGPYKTFLCTVPYYDFHI